MIDRIGNENCERKYKKSSINNLNFTIKIYTQK